MSKTSVTTTRHEELSQQQIYQPPDTELKATPTTPWTPPNLPTFNKKVERLCRLLVTKINKSRVEATLSTVLAELRKMLKTPAAARGFSTWLGVPIACAELTLVTYPPASCGMVF